MNRNSSQQDAARIEVIDSYEFHFVPHLVDYNTPNHNALACALVSSLSYVNDQTMIKQVASGWDCDVLTIGDHDPDSGLCLLGDDYLLIAFRGTDHASDWWRSNIRMMPEMTPWGLVHRGFLGAHQRLWPDLQHVLEQRADEALIWLTGHSLGGAIAQLTTMRIVTETSLQPSAVYTFSQPRAAGLTFSRYVCDQNVPYYRFTSSIDPTPNTAFNPFWSTVGTEIYIDATGGVHTEGHALAKFEDSLSQDGGKARYRRGDTFLGGLAKTLGFATHSVERYFGPLERALGSVPGRSKSS